MSIETTIWAGLILLAVAAAFMVAERSLFYVMYRSADRSALETWSRCCQRGAIKWDLVSLPELGWLGRQIETAQGNWEALCKLCRELREDLHRFDTVLAVTPLLAQLIGLFGTATGLAKCGTGVPDPLVLVGLAIRTTQAGLAIAIPTLFALAIFHKLGRGLSEEIEEVIEVLDRARELRHRPSEIDRSVDGKRRCGHQRPSGGELPKPASSTERAGTQTPDEHTSSAPAQHPNGAVALQVAVPLSAADDDNQGPDSWGVVDEVFVETGLPKDRDGKVMAPRHKRNGQQAAGGAQ